MQSTRDRLTVNPPGSEPGRRYLAPLLLLVLLHGGCGPDGRLTLGRRETPAGDTPSAVAPAIAASDPDPGGLEARRLIVLQVNIDVLRARVPRGFFSESEKVWNHLEEDAVAAATAALLQRNGLRVGRGRAGSWAPIKALLETEKRVEVSQSSITVNNGLPLSIQIDPRQREQTLFIFRSDGTLGGVTCPYSSNFLYLEYLIPPAAPDSVVLDVMPEIRQRPAHAELTINDLGQLDRPIVEPTRIFRELALRMEIGPEDFCAIGPSPASHQPHLIGAVLLCDETQGQPYESMYFLTPRVVRSDKATGVGG